MSFIVSNERQSTPLKDDLYQGVVIGIYGLGTQTNLTYGTSKRKVLILFELPEVMIEFVSDGVKMTVPRTISKKYTLSLSEKSALYKDLVSWRGKAFTDEELQGFDLNKLLGLNCMLQVITATGNNGKQYTNISAILPLYRGMQPYKPSTEPVSYEISGGNKLPASTPQWVKKIITESPEWRELEEGDNGQDNDVPDFG